MNHQDKQHSLLTRRTLLVTGATVTAGLALNTVAGAQNVPVAAQETFAGNDIPLQIYKGFSENRLDL